MHEPCGAGLGVGAGYGRRSRDNDSTAILQTPLTMNIPNSSAMFSSNLSPSAGDAALARVQPCTFQGQEAVAITAADGATATVLLHGAHVVSWRTPDGEEQLYLSEKSAFEIGRAVRGGVPIIFPQFELLGPLPRHGLARNRAWRLVSAAAATQAPAQPLAVFELIDDEATREIWPFAFRAELTVAVAGDRLDIELAVSNPSGDATLAFTAALHTYLRVRDVRSASLTGLQRLRYRDCLARTEQIDPQPALAFDGEIDRIYFDSARPLVLRDGERVMEVGSEGFLDAVVWNPGPQKCAQLADMPEGGWLEMLCIEAACIGEPVRVAPGQEWFGRQTLTRQPHQPADSGI